MNSLSVTEEREIMRAKYFIKGFDELLMKVQSDKLHDNEFEELNMSAYKLAQEIREFKLHLLTRQLTEKIDIHMGPTFINHMLNELDEYICILNFIMTKAIPRANPVHYHLLWLLDGSGHAAEIERNLDEVEKMLKDSSRSYKNDFKALYLKAVEMAGYLRTKLHEFPALKKFNLEAREVMLSFVGYLEGIQDLVIEKEVLGSINPLVVDHMLREECYYLTKLSMVVPEIEKPKCDPGKPRLEV
jgi:hypothetical protein